MSKLILITYCLYALICVLRSEDSDEIIDDQGKNDGNPLPNNESSLEYTDAALCKYCSYCKFCKLCDKECPCETSTLKPNCHMCKYCKFCYLCKMCDTFCQPGGFVDRVSSTLMSQLPKINKEEVDKEIDNMKEWIDKKKDEL